MRHVLSSMPTTRRSDLRGTRRTDEAEIAAGTSEPEHPRAASEQRSAAPPRDREVVMFTANRKRKRMAYREETPANDDDVPEEELVRERERVLKSFTARRLRLVKKFSELATLYPTSDAVLYFGRPDYSRHKAKRCDDATMRRTLGLTAGALFKQGERQNLPQWGALEVVRSRRRDRDER